MTKFYFSFLSFILLISSSAVAAETQDNPNVTETYPTEFVSDYTKECTQTSMEEGLTDTEAKTLCQCTIDEFQSQYTLEEFKKLTAASATDENASNTLIEVGQGCFESILYEQ
ncbi:MAG: hypothetical protein Tsb0014_05360 [Pleurocapsa sp.]